MINATQAAQQADAAAIARMQLITDAIAAGARHAQFNMWTYSPATIKKLLASLSADKYTYNFDSRRIEW